MNEVPQEIAAHLERMKTNLQSNLTILQERVNLFVQKPELANVQVLLSYFTTQYKLETSKLSEPDLQPVDNLEILRRFELWYTSRELTFPNNDWLATQRAKYQG